MLLSRLLLSWRKAGDVHGAIAARAEEHRSLYVFLNGHARLQDPLHDFQNTFGVAM